MIRDISYVMVILPKETMLYLNTTLYFLVKYLGIYQ